MFKLAIISLPCFLFLRVAQALSSSIVSPACNQQCEIDRYLGPRLSKQASIAHTSAAVERWSDFDAPDPGTVVNVASENDVLLTARYCIASNITFLAQDGGNIEFNADKTEVIIQGGAIVSEVVDAAYGNETQVVTGNCNCIGTLGATLGGGYGRLMGLYGLGVDNILSLRLVTALGTLITVNPEDADLWWALRGAGPNYGIVTSVTMKVYLVPTAQNRAWLGPLIFSEDKIEALVQAIDNLDLQPRMAIFIYFAISGPPNYTPSVITISFYLGNETEGRAAFTSIFIVGPVTEQTSWTAYNTVNAGSDSFCVKGGRKPSYTAGLAKMDPATWRAIWNEYNTFLQNLGTENTTVLVECYSLYKAMSIGDASSSYAFRSSNKYNAVLNTWYADASLDSKAEAFGSLVRSLWRSGGGLPSNRAYINYANGDESLETVYGNNVVRLQSLKREYDPVGRFN